MLPICGRCSAFIKFILFMEKLGQAIFIGHLSLVKSWVKWPVRASAVHARRHCRHAWAVASSLFGDQVRWSSSRARQVATRVSLYCPFWSGRSTCSRAKQEDVTSLHVLMTGWLTERQRPGWRVIRVVLPCVLPIYCYPNLTVSSIASRHIVLRPP